MKVSAIIQARMGSTRLPNKVMMMVMGRPLLGWMIQRVSQSSEINEIIIATTEKRCDDSIAEYSAQQGCYVYRGSEGDVLNRYYQAASIAEADIVVRLTADCPLLDPSIVDSLIKEFKARKVDFLSNSEPLPSSWPDGMDVSVMSYSALKRAHKNAKKPSEREHVTFHFWNNPLEFSCIRIDRNVDLSNYRITIDYPEDFEVIKTIIEHFEKLKVGSMSSIPMDRILDFLNKNNLVYRINKKYVRGMGWESAFQKDCDDKYL